MARLKRLDSEDVTKRLMLLRDVERLPWKVIATRLGVPVSSLRGRYKTLKRAQEAAQ